MVGSEGWMEPGYGSLREQGWLRRVPCCLFPSCVECCDPCMGFGEDVDEDVDGESHLSPGHPMRPGQLGREIPALDYELRSGCS